MRRRSKAPSARGGASDLRCTRLDLETDDRGPASAYSQRVSVSELLMSRARSLDPRLVDRGLALVLTVWAIFYPSARGSLWLPVPQDPLRALVLLTMTFAVAWRRRSPIAVLLLEVVGVALLGTYLDLPQGVAFLIVAYSAALYSDRQLLVLALLAAGGALFVSFGSPAQIPAGLVPFVLVAPAWLAGVAMRNREQRAEAADARADRLEREQEAALRAERARIARELHDVVTHSVSVMVLQTGAARQIMGRDEPRATELLESVETSGRTALEELRRLLGLLSDGDGHAPLSPQPGVTEIPILVERVKRAGLPVELRVEGEPRDISGGVAIAAYRIVQEALTNTLKHAGAAHARVRLLWSADRLDVEITDDGPATGVEVPPHPRPDSGGNGLVGMHERAMLYGGELEAGPAAGGGYRVVARLPIGSLR